MPVIRTEIDIRADPSLCFDLARSVDAHIESARGTGERAVAGRHFRDEMTRGTFSRIVHDHYFEPLPAGTRMIDVFDFRAPWGVLGRIAERAVLTSYLRRFLEERARALKQLAESGAGGRILADSR